MHAEEPKLLGGTRGLPFVGLAGTVAAMLNAFTRIGTEPHWKTVLIAVGFGVVVVGASLLVLNRAVRSRR